MELSEFLQSSEAVEEIEEPAEDIDVQKAVVEALAADKAEQDEVIASLRKDNSRLQSELAAARMQIDQLKDEFSKLSEMLVKNVEGDTSNKLSLLDRNVELDDRFQGETRDQVIEVLKESRDLAEQNGRLRRAQILESVLLVNEPNGELKKRRERLQRLFLENANIVSGPVIEALRELGLTHKNGEDYLLPSEIIARNY